MKIIPVVLLCLLIYPAADSWGGELERIREKGVITVSLNREYPPFSMEKEGKPTGLDVDLAYLVAHHLGVKVRFIRPEEYSRQIPSLLAGESDIIIAAMTRTVERGLEVSFTDPYFEVSQAALSRRDVLPAGANAYFDLLQIKKLRLGVKGGTTHEAFARELFPADAIRLFPTVEAAAQALLKGEVNAIVADSPFVRVWRDTHPELYPQVAALLAPVTREYYAFAIRPGDQTFLNWLNLLIAEIKADGTLDFLVYEYFEEMAWAGKPGGTATQLTRAKLIENRFMEKRRASIEQRRKVFQGGGDAYE